MKATILAAWLSGALVCSGQWYFEAGPWYRGNMEFAVTGGSSAAAEGVQAAAPGIRGGSGPGQLPPAWDATSQILRTFDDGQVGPSAWGWAREEGSTQHFSYQNAGQYNATANTLTFASTVVGESRTRRTRTDVASGAAGWSGAQEFDGAGALVTLGYTFTTQYFSDWGLQFQMGWLGGMDACFRNQTAWSQQVTWSTLTTHTRGYQTWNYVYDTLGNPSFPGAPYAMTDPGGVGALIADRPAAVVPGARGSTSRDHVVGRRQAVAHSVVDLDAEMNALVLVLGPRLRWQPVERLSLLVQGGATLNLLDADLCRTETFAWDDGRVIRAWTQRADEQEWLWGASLSAGLQYELTPKLYLHAAAGYDWVEDTELAIGPDRVRVDLSGYRAEIALGWRLGGTRGR